MNCSTPGLPVHHQLPEFTETHAHQVGDAIQPSHPLPSSSPPAPSPSQHQDLLYHLFMHLTFKISVPLYLTYISDKQHIVVFFENP